MSRIEEEKHIVDENPFYTKRETGTTQSKMSTNNVINMNHKRKQIKFKEDSLIHEVQIN
jgi:hypothetical protein